MEPVVKSKVRINFTWAFTAKIKTDAHILVDLDKRLKFPTPKVVKKATADLITLRKNTYCIYAKIHNKL